VIAVEEGSREGGTIQSVVIMVDRNFLAHQLFTGVSLQHLACLVEELADPWQAMVESRRHEARGGARKREAGAGARHRLVFVDRLVVTLIHLRHDLPYSVLAITPPRKANKIALPHVHAATAETRYRHSSKRIAVVHALADHKRWKQPTRWTRRREALPDTYRAIAGLVSDRTANA
jgi:hypothetical protein